MFYPLDIIMLPLQIFLFCFTIYFFIIGFFGLVVFKEKKITTPEKKFACLIAAHNEQAVVAHLVKNLQEMDYPKELYDIYVIADNCSDNTAEVSREAGAIVCERFDPEHKTKGYALDWMFDKLFAMEKDMDKPYDAVCIFDADNLVHPRFLMEMNHHLMKGAKIVQGFLDAKNPYDSWVSATFALSFWVIDYLIHQAKTNLGLSAVLGGTGMCITTEVLKRHGWRANCLVEDMEFTMKSLVEGIKTTWAVDAIIYDEKPLTFMQSWYQRKRWAQGQFDVAHRFIPKLLKEGIKQRSIPILDGCLYLIQPYFLMFTAFFILMGYIQVFYGQQIYTSIYAFMPNHLMTAITIIQYLLPMIILIKMRAKWKAWLYIPLYQVFIYSWLPIVFLGFIHRNEHEWAHTKHTQAVSYDQFIDGRK
ncbi:MAG: glycosyltransferase family 2 protein [Anaerovibrio sp.]|nr:glycosyltransferase family 2 protein [Anaerovibrio sp.]